MTDLEGSEDLFCHQRVEGMGEGGGERGVNGRLFTYSLALFFNFFKSLRVSFNHSPLVHISQKQPFLD